jgi:hypothetical protein
MSALFTLIQLGCTIEFEPSSHGVFVGATLVRIRIQDPGRDTLALYTAANAEEIESKLAQFLKER